MTTFKRLCRDSSATCYRVSSPANYYTPLISLSPPTQYKRALSELWCGVCVLRRTLHRSANGARLPAGHRAGRWEIQWSPIPT